MESLRVVLNLEEHGFIDGGRYKIREHQGEIVVGGMDKGTVNGKPVVMIGLNQGGNFLVAETTLALFLTAADALKAKYGDPRV